MIMRDPRSSRAGMTLIEIMVAVAIFSMVATLIFGGFSQTIRNKQAVQDSTDHAQVIRMAMERMVREFASAYVSVHRNTINPTLDVMRTAFHGRRQRGNARVDFTSFSHRRLYRDAHESDQCELSYFVSNHPEVSGRKVLVRREQRRPDEDPEAGGQNTMLVDDVVEFELEFLDPRSQQWVEQWDAQGTEQNRLPSQVKIRLVVPQLLHHTRTEVYQTRANVPIQWALNFSVYM